jgi:hypothetical protein
MAQPCHTRKLDHRDALRPPVVAAAVAVPSAIKHQKLIRADQDLAAEFADRCLDIAVAFLRLSASVILLRWTM